MYLLTTKLVCIDLFKLKVMVPMMMKAWQKQGSGVEHLNFIEVAIPQLKENDVLIKVKALSLNYRDKALLDGIAAQPEMEAHRFIPLSDVCGVVVKVGERVTRFKVGDRVITNSYPQWLDGVPQIDYTPTAIGGPLDGGLSEYMVLSEEGFVHAPKGLSDEEAATLTVAALTSWSSLIEHGKLKAGETVLTLGTGGVSLFAIQIALASGARVIATTSSETKAEKLRAIGVQDIIDYRKTPNWEEEVLKLTQGKGVNHVLEVVGGDSINRSIQSITYQGNIYIIGLMESLTSEVSIFSILQKQARLQGIFVGHRRSLEDMVKAFEVNQIKPIIDTVYPFEQAREAFKHFERGSFGKIVIKVSE